MLKTSKDERKTICILGLIQSTLKSRGIFPLAATDVLTWGSFDASHWHNSTPARPQNLLSKRNWKLTWLNTGLLHGSCLSVSPRTTSAASPAVHSTSLFDSPHSFSFYIYLSSLFFMAFNFFLALQIHNFITVLFNSTKVTYETSI